MYQAGSEEHLTALSLVENAWNAGSGHKNKEDSYHRNPWRFFPNGYFASLKDEHYGYWDVKTDSKDGSIHLVIQWGRFGGDSPAEAIFEKTSSTSFKCIQNPTGHAYHKKDWNLI